MLGKSDYAGGLVFLGVVVVLWVSSSFITSDLFTTGAYDKPFL